MSQLSKLSSIIAVIMFAGCGTPKIGTPEYAEYQDMQRQKEIKQQTKQILEKSPSWFLQPPVEKNAIYAVATDYSSDLQFAIDKSLLNAKVGLASQINNRVSSKMKEFAQEGGAANDLQVTREIERVSSELISDVNLSGYTVPKREIFQQGNGYRAYVMIRYPVGEANKLAVEQTKKNSFLESKMRASKAFQELEREINGASKE